MVADGARVALLRSGGGRSGRSSAAGRRGGRVRPAARTAPSSSRALVGAVERRRLPAVEQLDHRVHVVDLDARR